MVSPDDKVTEATLEPTAEQTAPDNGDAAAFMESLARNGVDTPGKLEKGAPEPDEPALPETAKLDAEIEAKKEFDAVDPGERERALSALRRSKTPQSVIDSLDDQALLAWGSELASQQAEVDRRMSGTKRAKTEDAAAAEPEPEKGTPAPAPQPLDLSELAKPLEEYLEGEGTEALGRYVSAVADHVRQESATQIEGLNQQVASMSGAMESVLMTTALRGLEGRFPGLADPANAAAVRAKMLTLGKTGEYGLDTIDSLASDAARLCGLDHRSSAAEPGRTLELDRMKNAGQGSVTGRRLNKDASPEERDRAAFDEALNKHL